MKKETSKQKGLPFFGIGKVLPYLKKYRRAMLGLMAGSLVGSLVDIGVPLFQRYALNHYIGEGTLDTIVVFVILYLLLICGGAAVLTDALRARGRSPQRIASTVLPYYLVMVALLVTAAVFGVYGEGFNPQDFVYFKY